ncbi:MAG: ADP-ribosylglycohydrolase family protein, partial [Clostridiales bacterium]|nr:ADP-ribosylglycohydrolase family protein [Clostridiales bacterium]
MKGKKLISIALSSLLLTSGVCALAACGDEPTPSGGDDLSSKDLPATTSVISLADYTSKVKAGIAGSMAGVAYGYKDFVHGKKWEFASKNWIAASILPKWSDVWVPNGYDQDDIYLAMAAIEALHNLGLDATSKELGIYMYNKNFEFWDGSNSDVLDRGYAPPYSGYPTDKTPDFTNAYSDGNSYQCGAEFGGYLGLNMTGAANELVHRVAEICTYGDGIYATQFIAAMYGAAFFTNDIGQVIDAGLAAIPEDSWSAEVIKDVLKNKEDGKSAEENYESIMKKYCDWNGSSYTSPYQWINWPSGNILLDAKMCSAFPVIGLLYGEGDLEKSVKYTVQCANDCDST